MTTQKLNTNEMLQLLGGDGGYRRINEEIWIHEASHGVHSYSWHFGEWCKSLYSYAKITLCENGLYTIRLIDMRSNTGKYVVQQNVQPAFLHDEFFKLL